MNMLKINSIIFNTSYLMCISRPNRLLNIIIADFNELNDDEKIFYIDKVLQNTNQLRTLLNLLRYSGNCDKWFLETHIKRRYSVLISQIS
mgnify:CR=1 FL=1